MSKKIKSFQIISETDNCIILKSKYHYWRIIKRDNMFFLHHKHKESDQFHIQKKTPYHNLTIVYNYIDSHDKYYENNNISI